MGLVRGAFRGESIDSLDEGLLAELLTAVSARQGGYTHALVCRRWSELSPDCQVYARATLWEGGNDQELVQQLRAFPRLRRLRIATSMRWPVDNSILRHISAAALPCLRQLEILERLHDREAMRRGDQYPRLGQGLGRAHGALSEILRSYPNLRSLRLPGFIGCYRLRRGTPCELRHLELSPWTWNSRHDPATLRVLRHGDFAILSGWVAGANLFGSQRQLQEPFPLDPMLQQNNAADMRALSMMKCLKSVLLRSDVVRTLPPGLGNLPDLEELSLYCPSLKELPSDLGKLTSLRTLMLRSRILDTIPPSLASLTNLRRLHLWCEWLERLPLGVERLQQLEALEMGFCRRLQAVALPGYICSMTSLTRLEAGDGLCAIAGGLLASGMGDSLRELGLCCIGRSGLEALGPVVGQMRGVTSLAFRDCGALSIPSSFGALTQLRGVHLHSCKNLVALPAWLGELGALTQLSVDHCNQLREGILPEDSSKLSAVRFLNLFGVHSIRRLPASLTQLTSLRWCKLHSLSLATLPSDLGSLSVLRGLSLSRCLRLVALPELLGELKHLEDLTLHLCISMRYLPSSLGRLSSLQKLTLVGLESLEALPEDVQGLVKLSHLTIHETPRLRDISAAWQNLPSLSSYARRQISSLLHAAASSGDVGTSSEVRASSVECDWSGQ